MSNLKPNACFERISEVDFDFLKANNIEGILVDVDNTLIDKSKKLFPQNIDWINRAKELGFKLCILSNTNKLDKVEPVSKELGIDYIAFAKKPAKSGFLKAIQKLNLPSEKLCMIGDQVFTDVWGANKVGIFSIYVKPINKKEYWYTAWKRPIEALILKHFGY